MPTTPDFKPHDPMPTTEAERIRQRDVIAGLLPVYAREIRLTAEAKTAAHERINNAGMADVMALSDKVTRLMNDRDAYRERRDRLND